MATTVSAWGKPGAWALDSEENEEMLMQEQQQHQKEEEPSLDFPSLAAAAATKPSKKKKGQTLSLAEFSTGKPVAPGSGKFQVRSSSSHDSSANSKGLTTEELRMLPTGPRERTAEELERAGSRGFNYSSYGTGGGRPRMNGGGEDSVSRWGSSRVSDEPRRGASGGFDRDMDLAPSRADEIDDWGAAKRSAPPPMERRERTGGFFGSQSKADDTDSWISNKSPAPAFSEGRRGGDGYRERRGGFEMFNKDSLDVGSGSDSDTWGRRREVASGGGLDSDSWARKREEASGGRPRLMLQQRTLPLTTENGGNHAEQQPGTGARSKGSNPFGAARPREEVLAEKGQDWKKIDEQLESMKIREVGPAHGESPNENGGQQAEQQQVTGTRSKGSNPFGAARPREEVLAEKGQDWKKIDEQLESKIREVGSAQGERQPFEKRAFGTGIRQGGLPEVTTEKNWRKMESIDVPASPPRAENENVEGAGGEC